MLKINKNSLKYLKELTSLDAISGREDEVRNYLKNAYLDRDLVVEYDELGSIVAHKKEIDETLPKVLVIAHMDEVGFVVKQIFPNGLIGVNVIGGVTLSRLPSSRLILTTKNNKKYYGSISALAPHLGESNKDIKSSDLTFDFGFASEKEALKAGVNVNDMIVEEGNFKKIGKNRYLAKAFDNRYGCALGLDLLDALRDEKLNVNLYVGATVQEEVGCRGAITLSHMIKPDVCIILDCSPANDYDGNKNANGKLGAGVLIRYLDRGVIANKALLDLQIDMMEQLKLPYQYFQSAGTTDGSKVQLAYDGVLLLSHCLCARNIHSPSSIIDGRDYEAARISLVELVKKFDKDLILKLRKETIYGRD